MSETSSSALTMEKLKTNLNAFGARVKTSGAAAGKTLSEQMTVVSGKMKDLFHTPTQADKLVDEATAESLEGPDWGKILEICDTINVERLSSADVVRAVKRRLLLKNAHVQMLSLILLEAAAKNCDRIFSEIASEKVLDEMVKIGDDPIAAPEIREKCLKLIEAWGEATDELRFLPVFEETYKSLKSRGIRFPGRDNESLAPIFTPPQTHPVVRPPEAVVAVEDMIPREPIGRDPKEELAVARNTVELLNTVLTSAPSQEALQDELTPTLVVQCRQCQSTVQHIIETAGENETLLFEALNAHDELAAVLTKYESMRAGGGAPAPPRVTSEGPAPLVAVSATEEEEPPAGAEGEGLVRNRAAARAGGGGGSDARPGAAVAGKTDKKDEDDLIVF